MIRRREHSSLACQASVVRSIELAGSMVCGRFVVDSFCKNNYTPDVARTGVLKLVPKAHLRHALRSRNHVSSAGVFIRSFTPHLLFLLAR
jgi:hypothetical protein